MLRCSRCNTDKPCPSSFSKSTFAQQPFVCEDCRCKSCSIVLNIDCECGERHADPSIEDPQICTECISIRDRVADLDPELLRLRNTEMIEQECIG